MAICFGISICCACIQILCKSSDLVMLVFLHLVFILVEIIMIIIAVMMKYEVYVFISAYCLPSL